MWRRGDQAHSRCGKSRTGNPRIDLLARQMSALTRLRTLCHLDLNLFCADQIAGGHTKSAGGHLLDRGAAVLSIRSDRQTIQTLTALTGV